MKRHLSLAIAAVLVLAVAASAAFARSAANPVLKGTVGPSFTINLTKDGKKVKTLKPGKYTFKITDRSSFHNFELEKENSKFEKELTDVSDTGSKTYTITLTKGTYKYYCKPHESQMHGSFTVK